MSLLRRTSGAVNATVRDRSRSGKVVDETHGFYGGPIVGFADNFSDDPEFMEITAGG